MNGLSTDAVEFFTIVLNSGLIALAALVVASVIAFTSAFVLFRERSAELRRARVGSVVEIRPQGKILAAGVRAAGTPTAIAG